MTDGAPADVFGDISFRAAEETDVPLLAELNQQLIQDEEHRNTMSLEQLEDRMCRFLSGDYRASIFESGGEILGYALFRPEAEHLYVRQFYVRPEFRRRGVGRAAVAWLRKLAWRNHARMRLDVLTTNTAALEFWRSVGFSDYCITMECDRDEGVQSLRTAPAPPPQQD